MRRSRTNSHSLRPRNLFLARARRYDGHVEARVTFDKTVRLQMGLDWKIVHPLMSNMEKISASKMYSHMQYYLFTDESFAFLTQGLYFGMFRVWMEWEGLRTKIKLKSFAGCKNKTLAAWDNFWFFGS